jgi:hypothetical protein
MAEIIGSIDNAVHQNKTYYLIFADNEMYQFMTMDSREKRSELYHAQISNPYLMLTGGGGLQGYKITQDTVASIIQENISKGQEIEKNFESKRSEIPPQYTLIPYSAINQVELTNGTLVTLPHVLFKMGEKNLKFHLVHDNYKGRGKLSDDIFSKYEEVLRKAFESALIVKN